MRKFDDLSVFVPNRLAGVFPSLAQIVLVEERLQLLLIDFDHVLALFVLLLFIIDVIDFLTFILIIVLVLHAIHAHVLLLLEQLLVAGVVFIDFFLIVNFLLFLVVQLVHVPIHLVLTVVVFHVVLLIVFAFDLHFVALVNDLLVIVIILLVVESRLLFILLVVIVLIFLVDHLLLLVARHLQASVRLLGVLLVLLLLLTGFVISIHHLGLRHHHRLVLSWLNSAILGEVSSRLIQSVEIISAHEQFPLLICQVLIRVHSCHSEHDHILLKLFNLV